VPTGPPFQVSGVVTSEDGQPLAGADVIINSRNPGSSGSVPVTVTRVLTDGLGQYHMTIDQSILGPGYAHVSSGDYENDLQMVVASGSAAVRNFRMNRAVRVAVGEPVTVTFRGDDNLCNADESNAFELRCRYVHLAVPADGKLTVIATPVDSAMTSALLLGVDGDLWPSGMTSISTPVKRGDVFKGALRIPLTVSRLPSYVVSSSLSR